ncbi:DUF3040 domain-containing protein [Streptomyces griseoloalbus]|uniref:DUF3040 domain-containing protein n=1 Tax=Streptomyces griseoloalbus TaxID=67303 RepID=A0A7W8FA65_9ACTN|nr:DUF3040 domain-containing protein [Streptomyces albaduncus]MBB5127862.1 hypothetical protein [Streptomyces albaduncus]GGV75790.1 hypothetical protein GCM10010294_40920 [Streptomyces griseoloalbus]GGW60518.1 hypothetical protein GCM10010340_43470 [Streptomyces albaduncus]
MPQSDDERLVDLAARLEHEDPRFTRSLSAGRPARPREYRRRCAWWLLAIGVIMLIAGVVVADGLLIAAGLVLAGIAVQLLDPDHPRTGGRHRPPRH